ncbi:MAG: hypothetical protein HY376_03220 [Candidatus Blackburnbacteria bacterium]|nr:hypothetical protein [Candidatus Blackburnbacteria bacterium]
MKRKRYYPNVAKRNNILALGYVWFSVPLGRRKQKNWMIGNAADLPKLKKRFKGVRQANVEHHKKFSFFDELSGLAYVARRNNLQNQTTPLVGFSLENIRRCWTARAGLNILEPLSPS